jgi:O-acetyl-ADP-ribose deacetylase (regulator of RNase III)
MLAIHLRDINMAVVEAWEKAFADAPDVLVSQGDIFEHTADAIVSPANSFGYMDGGIDLAYSMYFGWEIEANLKALLSERHYGELPVGQAVVLPTGHAHIPFLISAPTMRIPASIGGTPNVYLAFRAALIAALSHNVASDTPIQSLLVPGFGTGVGKMAPEQAARQMRLAYDAIVKGHGVQARNTGIILREHRDMVS